MFCVVGSWGRGGPPPLMMGGPRGHHRGGNRGHRGGRGKQPQHTILCNKFPNCPYGNECKFLHPGENGPPLS